VADLTDGSVAEGDRAEELAARGPFLDESDRKTTGFFDHERGLVFYRGEREPVGSALENGVQVRDLAVSPDGEWAAFTSPADSNLYLVDGRARRKTLLLPGWGCYLTWLPSAPTGNR
jgi:hypothetical protein